MEVIRLARGEWEYDPNEQLGAEGGFGVVFAGNHEKYGRVAVKRLKIGAREAAHRELKIAEELVNRQLAHVIPVLDSGRDSQSDCYFVIMARAERSLQDEINDGRTFQNAEARRILLEIVEGLFEVSDIVHRDLKPSNVLYHEGRWKVADFGIARFVEESTSLRTLKECLTPEYAAPEQWKLQRATNATDIYALGCIGYALLTGKPPFRGPNFREQHLHESPPVLANHSRRLCSLIAMALRKVPEVRPNLVRLKELLSRISQGDEERLAREGFGALERAGAEVAAREAKEEAERKLKESQLDQREQIASEGRKKLGKLAKQMWVNIESIVPNAECAGMLGETRNMLISIGSASLELKFMRAAVGEGAFCQSGWDVIIGATIKVSQAVPGYERSASLWYSKMTTDDNYRWREVSYRTTGFVTGQRIYEPFALTDVAEADLAAGPAMHIIQIEFGPKPIDDEDFDEFFERWAKILAKAVSERLG